MKNVSRFVLAVVAIAMWSCSKESQNVTPVSQHSLGLVVPKIDGGSVTGNLLLLKDGRTANPISGISGFSSMKVGDKLSVTFLPGSTQKGVLDINVTTVASAPDSTFVPTPTGTDTTSAETIFNGTYSGTVGFVQMLLPDSISNPYDSAETIVTHPLSIVFRTGEDYICPGANGNYPAAGSGGFSILHGTFSWMGTITFTDSSTGSSLVLNGTYNYFISNTNLLCLYGERNGVQYSFYLQKQ